ncbi:MAG: response regulator [Vulcanimicrobiota bacterium]
MEKKKILVVEDELQVRELIKVVLKLENYDVEEAGNGVEALQKLEEYMPDIILTDVMMPEMDGVQFFLTIRETRKTASIPVIILTVKGQMEDLKYANLLGVDAYITKPFNPNDLVRQIKELLKQV